MLPWLPPRRVRLELHGEYWEDYIPLPGDEFLVSEQYVTLHRDRGFTGMEAFAPVEVVRVKHHRKKHCPALPVYFCTSVKRSAARFDDKASAAVRDPSRPICSECGGPSPTQFDRIVIAKNTWHGEDWFQPENLTRELVTNRVVEGVNQAGLKGLCFVAADQAKYRERAPRDIHGNVLDD